MGKAEENGIGAACCGHQKGWRRWKGQEETEVVVVVVVVVAVVPYRA